MKVERFAELLGADFFTGVPDSQLKALCDYLMATYGADSPHHIIAANEGACTGIAAGYHLATGRVPVVYMQNSGQGNVINPLASLLHDKVYGIPCIFVIGWRGEPGAHDEPQHIFQGEVTLRLMETMGVATWVLSKDTTDEELAEKMAEFAPLLTAGKQVAIVVRKGALKFDGDVAYANENTMLREEIISHITRFTGEDPIVSTTGKASRELFEIREARGEHHGYDFLTVGSMGHSSSIALGIAMQRPDRKVWVIDGDGAVLMHMGSLAVLGAKKPKNLVHIVINNGAHETVGGQPTALAGADLVTIARGCGYPSALRVTDFDALDAALGDAKSRQELTFLEVACAIGARPDLGRPTTTAAENKRAFMEQFKKPQ